MANATKERIESKELKIGAVMSEGQPIEPARAAHDVAQLFARDIDMAMRVKLPAVATEALRELVAAVIERRLSTMLEQDSAIGSSPGPTDLPVAHLKPAEVIGQPNVRMSLATLYRNVDAHRFYCIVPAGQRNGREFPAWQFVQPVPELLPAVLSALRGAARTEVHAFLVTAQDALNELSPAEVLAGTRFATRTAKLHASQLRLLRLPATERQRRVLGLIESHRHGVDE